MKNIIAMLRCYEAVLGLKVNVFKSLLIGASVDPLITDLLADVLGCKVRSHPMTYLGLPLSWGSVPKSLWSPVVERVEHKLATGRARYLFLDGRISLIRSALANLPVYFMPVFRCLASVSNRCFNWIFSGKGAIRRRNSIW